LIGGAPWAVALRRVTHPASMGGGVRGRQRVGGGGKFGEFVVRYAAGHDRVHELLPEGFGVHHRERRAGVFVDGHASRTDGTDRIVEALSYGSVDGCRFVIEPSRDAIPAQRGVSRRGKTDGPSECVRLVGG